MRAFAAPAGYLALRDARDELMFQMHEGVAPSKDVEQFRSDACEIGDHAQTMAAVDVLRKAVLSGELGLYADLSTRQTPRRLSLALCEGATKPSDGGVLTFIYLDRLRLVPIGLSWPEIKELTQDPLCVDEKAFRSWLRREERKKAWPCHRSTSTASRRKRGRPRKQDKIIEVLKDLVAKEKLEGSMQVKQVHALVEEADPSLPSVSDETVRRAMNKIGL